MGGRHYTHQVRHLCTCKTTMIIFLLIFQLIIIIYRQYIYYYISISIIFLSQQTHPPDEMFPASLCNHLRRHSDHRKPFAVTDMLFQNTRSQKRNISLYQPVRQQVLNQWSALWPEIRPVTWDPPCDLRSALWPEIRPVTWDPPGGLRSAPWPEIRPMT